ncbi:MAG: hypothetical protein ABI665_25560, partial [Vicinamibacterales bacterium]
MRFHLVLLSFIVAVPALVPALATALVLPHAATQAAAAEATTITLSGVVTTADKGNYQERAFEVPAAVTRIDVDFAYDNRGQGTELEVGLFDSQRFRGTSRFSKDHFHLTEFEATPSYFAGPLPAGTWRLSLGIPSIGAGQSSKWTATIRLSTRSTPIE